MPTMSRIKLQKIQAMFVMQRIRALDPTAYVAGGAPRDWFLDREASDIDIYMTTPTHNKEQFEHSLKMLFGDTVINENNTEFLGLNTLFDGKYQGEDSAVHGIQYVYEIKAFKGNEFNTNLPTQLIVFYKPYDKSMAVSRFDCDICKVKYDDVNDKILMFNSDVKKAFDTETVTYRSGVTHAKSKHAMKMVSKFPKWNHVWETQEPEPYIPF